MSDDGAPFDRSQSMKADNGHRHQRIHILGEAVDLIRPDEVLGQTREWVEGRVKALVANHNLHSLYLLRDNEGMRAFYDLADLVQLDSTPLIWFARLKGLPTDGRHRSTYLDWRSQFWGLANRKAWRVFHVGGTDGVAETAAARLSSVYPDVAIGTHSGYFDIRGPANSALLEAIQAFKPDILFVGMGMPRQELWIKDNYATLPACVIFNIGAAFDYEAGIQKAAPRWMGKLGVEWLFRLTSDPKRLFRRYCVEPWFLAGPAIRDLASSRSGD